MPTGKETIKALEDHYAKLLAIVMNKYRLRHIVISQQDILDSQRKDGINLAVQEMDDGLHLRILSDKEAIRLQRLEDKLNPPR